MCGRYTLSSPAQNLADEFDLADLPELAARYNIAPTQEVAAVLADRDSAARVMRRMRWGLIPHWAKDPSIGSRMINARAETVASKPAFREAFQRRRCLLPADGFYEWKRFGARKQPMYLRMLDGRPFAFAGLWARWRPEDGEPVESCTIVTTEPNDLVADIHNRMPVILPPEAYGPWLDPESTDPTRLTGMLQPYPAEEMIAYPVSTRVNRPGNDDSDCVEPVEAPETGPGSLFD